MIVVNVESGTVGGAEHEVVDGRELHAKLGNKDQFANWIKDRISQLNFFENQHFAICLGNSKEKRGRGRPPIDYHLTLVAAKKIAMSEHTDAGNAVRDYFLDRERISYEAPGQPAQFDCTASVPDDWLARPQTLPATP